MGDIRWIVRSSAASVILAITVAGFSLPTQQNHLFGYCNGRSTKTSLQLVETARVSVTEALQKPSKILTTCLEYDPTPDSSESDITVLSMQLRKVGTASIWTSDLNAMRQFKEEQATAIGNFPGPCPVVYKGDGWKEAMEVADAIVVPAGKFSDWKEQGDSDDMQVIWSVSNADDVKELTAEIDAPLNLFIESDNGDYNEETLSNIFSQIPAKSVTIFSVYAMQTDNNELSLGRSLKSNHGCTSILVKGACVGDAEDVPYATFIVSGFKSKKSASFDMTGLTGSTNGHFGGIASSGTQKWQRVAQQESKETADVV